jgi:hypothetical protein
MFLRLPISATVAATAGLTLALGVAPTAHAAGPATWFVNAASGADSSSCGGTSAAACKSIGQAVTNAAAGDTVMVAAGTYAEQVTIMKTLTLLGPGVGNDASGRATVAPPASVNNGFLLGAGSAGSTVSGFWVQGAQGEGILATQTTKVTIADNAVQNNDQGASNPSTTYQECQAQGPVPGDCGEGIHLMSVTRSSVVWNESMSNSGGILLSDEVGPTANNVIAHNVVINNNDDCGITVVGHNPNAFANGKTAPSVAGVYSNTIADNVADHNGVVGQGAGIILAGAGPGTAVYHNVISGNTAHANGLAGVTLHDHAPGQFLDGNVIVGNNFDGNDTTGGPGNTPGDQDTGQGGLTQSADVIIFSAVDIVKYTVVSDNVLSNAHFGIWTHNAPTITRGNQAEGSTNVPLMQAPGPVRTTIHGPASAARHSMVSLTGRAEPSVEVTVWARKAGGTWFIAARPQSTSGGLWSAKVLLRYAVEYFHARAYASTSSTIAVRATS